MSLFRWFQHVAMWRGAGEPQGCVGGGLSIDIMAAGSSCLAWDVSLARFTTFSSVPASFDRLGFET